MNTEKAGKLEIEYPEVLGARVINGKVKLLRDRYGRFEEKLYSYLVQSLEDHASEKGVKDGDIVVDLYDLSRSKGKKVIVDYNATFTEEK